MTLIAPEPSSRVTSAALLALVPSHRLTSLQRQICRSVQGRTARPLDPWLAQLVSDAVETFVDSDGQPSLAADLLAGTFRELGEHHARRGGDADVLSRGFARSRAAVLAALPVTLGEDVSGAAVARLRQDIVAFLSLLHQHARAAHDRTQRIMAMPLEDRSAQLRIALFRRGTTADVDALARGASLDPQATLRAVVATTAPLPSSLLQHDDTLSGLHPFEALVPARWHDDDLSRHLSVQVVAGPPATLQEVPDSVDLTRRGAALLRDQVAADDRTVVPCADLAGPLVVGGNPYLNEMIVAKRLLSLEQTGVRRRVQLGELLLEWLERGIPLTRLAAVLDVNVQTAHSRMKVLRDLFGDALDEPAARLELILALHTVLPRWRAQVQKSL